MTVSAETVFRYDVFISYSHADSEWVWNWLVPRLKAADLRVCIDRESFDVGLPSLLNMERAAAMSRNTLLVLTPAWINSEWGQFESLLVQTADPGGLRRRLVPVLREPCDLPSRLAILTYADLTGRVNADEEFAKILKALHDAINTPMGEPTRTEERARASLVIPTIGICTALPKEYAAVEVLLKNVRSYVVEGRGSGRRYLIGEIPASNGSTHTVVLGLADQGNNSAATRVTLLLEHFPSVSHIVMTGIAGGIPNPDKAEDHVRLGDIVVSSQGGVIQYDFVKETKTRKGVPETVTYRNSPRPPSASMLEAVRLLKAAELRGKRPWTKFVRRTCLALHVERPAEETDLLASTDDATVMIAHPSDPERKRGIPKIFIGTIASSSILLKNPKKRDALRDRFGVKAVEMEGSGIADATWNQEVGYLVVRGICDYCDANKGDAWQMYAAVVAAAYTRALLESIPATQTGRGRA